MNIVDQALENQLKNIQSRTGKTLEELYAFIRASGLTRHGEIRDMLKRELGLGYGDASQLTGVYQKSLQPAPTADADPVETALAEIYSGSKAGLRQLHDHVMAAIRSMDGFEIAPKKTYISLRRKRQFAMLGPGSKGRIELGLNMKNIPPTDRLEALPPGGMCQYRVFITAQSEVDTELMTWIKMAFDAAA
jgi:hypothetical protein